MSDGGCGPVAGEHPRLGGEGKDFRSNAREELVLIPARQVPSSGAASKKHVSAEEDSVLRQVQADAAWTVAGHIEDAERNPAKLHRARFLDEKSRLDRLDLEFKSPPPEEAPVRHHRGRVGMAADRAAVPGLNCRSIRDVIEMSMRQDKDIDALAGESLIGSLRCVDEDVPGGSVDQVAIGVECPARKLFELNHWKMVCAFMRSLLFRQCSATLTTGMFKKFIGTGAAFAAAALLLAPTPASSRSGADLDKVAVSVARVLESVHYSRRKLDDEMSRLLLNQYLLDLDPNKLFFTQQDVDEFTRKYAEALDDAIFSGNLDPARDIYSRYAERVTARVAANKKLAVKDYNFSSDRAVQLDRRDGPWPKDIAEADQLWADRVEAELLQQKLDKESVDPPEKVVLRRQDQMLRNVKEEDDEGVVSGFLAALARTYDPHSEYMSPSQLVNFEIDMKKSLDGVGAVLQSEDGYAKVKEIVPGGPADLEGHLKVNDRIAAVAQGDQPFEDVVEMKLDKVVEKIRGRKGSIVRLQVIPADATDSASRKIVTIRRDKVDLKEQKASAEIIDMKRPDGRPIRIGWIELPSFYADLENRDSVSTTRDVLSLLTRLKKEGIEGLVVDLRQDGGGSLEEAINLTGLFIPKGPVVQSKDSNGKVSVSYDHDADVAFSGPMVVLINRLSASASEIFAAALQDYGRAVIVGDERSFGKGTVQTMLDIGRVMPFFNLGASDAGALKLTINKFYRVRGGSTQFAGVTSDIVLPSLTDNPEIGESTLPNALPYDEVAPQRISRNEELAVIIPELRDRSTARVGRDREFSFIADDMERLRKKLAENAATLNLAERTRELADDASRKESRKEVRAKLGPAFDATDFEIKLDDVDAPNLREVAFDRKRSKSALDADDASAEKEEVIPDAVRNEALRIAADLIDLAVGSKTASVTAKPPIAQESIKD